VKRPAGDAKTLLVRTREMPAHDQFALWREVICKVFMEMEPHAESVDEFNGSFESREFGPLTVASVTAQQHWVRRSRTEISGSSSDVFLFHFQVSGRSCFRRRGVEEVVMPGDIACIDATEPFDLSLADNFHSVTVKAPRQLFESILGPTPSLPRVKIGRESEFGALLREYMKLTQRNISSESSENDLDLSSHLCDVLAMAQSGKIGDIVHSSNKGRSVLLTPILSYLYDNIGNGAITPTAVATRFGISVRYLHKLFEEMDVTLGRWLLLRRLEMCFQDLTDPDLDNMPISSIAYSRGFNDLSYFGRSFKSHYGATPREVRNK